jgi:hypothetical protein
MTSSIEEWIFLQVGSDSVEPDESYSEYTTLVPRSIFVRYPQLKSLIPENWSRAPECPILLTRQLVLKELESGSDSNDDSESAVGWSADRQIDWCLGLIDAIWENTHSSQELLDIKQYDQRFCVGKVTVCRKLPEETPEEWIGFGTYTLRLIFEFALANPECDHYDLLGNYRQYMILTMLLGGDNFSSSQVLLTHVKVKSHQTGNMYDIYRIPRYLKSFREWCLHYDLIGKDVLPISKRALRQLARLEDQSYNIAFNEQLEMAAKYTPYMYNGLLF